MKYYNYFFITIFIFFTQTLCANEILDLGKIIFLEKGNCATCHALNDAGSNAEIGPNLNLIRPDKMRVISAVIKGIGVMPSYEDELTKEEIEAVAHYVSTTSQQ